MTRFCTNCGAAIPDEAKFCPRCGKPADTPAAPVVTTTATARSRVGLFAGVAVTLVILGIAVWALLTGMPFANQKKLPRTQQPAPPVINEQEPNGTSTTSQIRYPADQEEQPSGAGRGTEVIATTTTAMPVQRPSSTTAPPPAAPTRPAPPAATITVPVSSQPSAPAAASPARTPPPAAVTQTRGSEIGESQAEDLVRRFVVSRDYYQAGSDCVGIASQGYKNRGYTIDVVDRCGARGRLGRWRVDTVTSEIFVQKPDGRYLRP